MSKRLQNGFGILLILSFFGYAFFSSLPRKQFTESLFLYAGLFAAFLGIYWITRTAIHSERSLFPVWLGKWIQQPPHLVAWLLAGIALRLVFLWDTPSLSQDFFRFIWDGHLLINGFNPYLYTPDELIAAGVDFIPNASLLHSSMGALSSSHYTNYPPLNQALFGLCSFLGGDSIIHTVMWMRLLIIIADVAIFIYGLKLLRLMGRSPYFILLYYFNPFIIIELTGNLHWEGVMACLLLIGVYYFIVYDRIKSAVFIACSILLKLMPLMIIPVFLKGIKWERLPLYLGIILVLVFVGFVPFLSGELFDKYASSVGLWFGTFEFNASIYYLIREVGFMVKGYNIIGTAGRVLPVFTLITILLIAAIRKNQFPDFLLSSIVFSFTIYLLLSTTVHPWYLTIPLLFSIFTRYRFILLWSFMVFLSYSAYSYPDYKENLWLVGLEYAAVIGMMVFELFSRKRNNYIESL